MLGIRDDLPPPLKLLWRWRSERGRWNLTLRALHPSTDLDVGSRPRITSEPEHHVAFCVDVRVGDRRGCREHQVADLVLGERRVRAHHDVRRQGSEETNVL